MDKCDLTAKQKRFCDEYLKDFNGAQAAIRAGYSESSAKEIASENLTKPNIQLHLEKKQQKIAEKLEITQEKVLAEYAKLAFSNMSDFVEWNEGAIAVIPGAELTDEQKACVAEIIETQGKFGSNVRIKLHDKKGALDSIARYLGMFNDKLEVSGALSLKSQIEEDKELARKCMMDK